jgi:hypothetical protein
MAFAQIRTDNVKLGRTILQHHQNFDRVTEIIMIELVVPDAVEFHRFLRRQHEIERRSSGPSVRERSFHATCRDLVLAYEDNADIPAGRIW